jgi:hypothetical protein
VEELDDAKILETFEGIKRKYKDDGLRSWDSIFKPLVMDMQIRDPIERVSDYAVKFNKLVRINVLSDEVKDPDVFRTLVLDYLIPRVRPEGLKARMQQLMKRDKKIASEKVHFFKVLEQQAVADKQAFEVNRKIQSSGLGGRKDREKNVSGDKRKSFEKKL